MSKPLHLLIIEDSENDALLLVHELRRGGYDPIFERVDTVAAMKAALDQKSWHVIIADYNMPHFSGLAALQLLQETGLDLPFILVSGAIGEEIAVEAMKAGAHDYVMKDNLARLVPAIERELREAEVRRERKQAEAEIHRRNRELHLLNRVIAASAVSFEPEAILTTVCRELALAFEIPRAAAALINKEQTATVIVAEYLAEGQSSALNYVSSLVDNPAYQYLLKHKEPLVAGEVQSDPRLASIHHLLRQLNIVSLLLLPLIIEEEIVGSLSLGAIDSRHFSAEEISLARSVADQVAGALARAQLSKEHRWLSAAIEQAAESVVITNTGGTILYVNPAFERLTGYSYAEVVGQNLPIFQDSEQQDPAFYQKMWTTISTGQVWHERFANKKKDGTVYMADTTITPLRDERGTIINYVSVQRDVTRELQLEQQYRQAQRMEAVGRLAAGIAHDFNNLLTAINGFADLLKVELSSDDPLQELVDKILRSGRRAADLVRQLLAFSRKQVITPRLLDLNVVVTDMNKMLRRIIGEHIELEIVLTPDLWSVKADPAQMEQVIVNLAVNARDAMPDGGRLTIKTANVILGTDHLDAQPGQYVLLTVSDTGIGMSEDIQARLFEPFFTTKEQGKGTGLGLATIFGIVKQSEGHISVDSKPGQGATFKVYLPRVAEATAPKTEPGLTSSLPQGTETILLVEDESAVRELAARVLQQQGYTVLEAANGQEALRLTQAHNQEIHLLLTDVIMPHMDGKLLADRLKGIHPQIKVLFMSGYTGDTISHHGVLDSGVMFIQKPFSPATLARKVRDVLDLTNDQRPATNDE